MKRSNSKQRRSEGETGQLVLRAAEAHHEAEVARKHVRLAKAEYKKARKAFKKAKKAARQARKLAKAASRVLKAQAKDRAAKRRLQSKQGQSARPPQKRKNATKPRLSTATSTQTGSTAVLPISESAVPPPDISPPTSPQL
jgi:hypothetical protein